MMRAARPRWSQASTDYLKELAGDYPLHAIHRYFNLWAKEHGEPPRTFTAIELRMRVLQLSIDPEGIFLSLSQIARMIGRSRSALYLWVKWEWIAPTDLLIRRTAGRRNHIWVHRRAIVKLARRRPEVFSGADRFDLYSLLEDEDLVDSVIQASRNHKRVKRAVICNGRRFPSVRAAALYSGVDHTTVLRSLRTGKPSTCGLLFREA